VTHAPNSQLIRVLETDSRIGADYQHRPKLVTTGPSIEPPGAVLKWYDVYRDAAPIPDSVTQLARARLTVAPLEARGLGFVVLHRCESDFYFLIVCTWRNCNELWQTVFYKEGQGMRDFQIFLRDGAHKPMLCVWELVPVQHERHAWLRFLDSARDAPAALTWLNELYAGPA
jgi:hypothetical protein